MMSIAQLDKAAHLAKGPVDTQPEELTPVAELIASAQYNVGRAYCEGEFLS